jgi:hypothetical protein
VVVLSYKKTHQASRAHHTYEDQQKIADMTANSTNSFLEAWSALVEAVRNGVVKHVSGGGFAAVCS